MYKSPKSAFEFGPRECMALLMWKSANLDKTQKCKRDNVWRWRSSNCFFLLMHIWKAWGILFLSQQNKCQMACFNWSIRSPTVVLSRHFHFPNTLSMNIWMANIQKLHRQLKVAYACTQFSVLLGFQYLCTQHLLHKSMIENIFQSASYYICFFQCWNNGQAMYHIRKVASLLPRLPDGSR